MRVTQHYTKILTLQFENATSLYFLVLTLGQESGYCLKHLSVWIVKINFINLYKYILKQYNKF